MRLAEFSQFDQADCIAAMDAACKQLARADGLVPVEGYSVILRQLDGWIMVVGTLDEDELVPLGRVHPHTRAVEIAVESHAHTAKFAHAGNGPTLPSACALVVAIVLEWSIGVVAPPPGTHRTTTRWAGAAELR